MESLQDFWKPYEPTSAAPWNLRRAVHLHRGAGFAATWSEIQRDLAGDPQQAVERLLKGQTRLDAQPADYQTMAAMLTDTAVRSQMESRQKAVWVYRMLFSPDPLGERLVLTWHNHFATSNRKVQNLEQMHQQNDALRRLARARFAELLAGAVHSPALLVWLDADKNSAEHPNENLARELLELFTLGIGHYSEQDVQESARALTGWKVVGDQFRFDAKHHDAGSKTILGQSAAFTGDDLLAKLAEHPATARRLAWRLCREFMGEDAVDPAAIESLSEGLVKTDFDIGWAVETVLRSRAFFATENIGTRIRGPAEYVVGTVRALECLAPAPSTLLLADWMARMGQELFNPPNVGGWNEGRAWLASGAIVARANFVAALVQGRLNSAGLAAPLDALVARHGADASLSRGVEWFGELLFGGLPSGTVGAVEAEARQQNSFRGGPLAAAVQILLTRPEAHLA